MKRLYILSILTFCSSLAAMEPVCGKRTAGDGTASAAKRIHQDQEGADDAIVMLLIQRDAPITFKALMHAVNKGRPSTIKLLLDHGASTLINKNENADGGTPLHYAHTVEVADLLVQAGAQVDTQNIHGETPLHRVIKNLVFDDDAKFNDSAKLINYYLDHGASTNNCTYFKGETPLYTLLDRFDLCFSEDKEMVERCINILTLLLERGASLTRTHARATHDPIHHVFLCNHYGMDPAEVLAILRCLVEHGADITAQDSEHKTVLTLAREYIRKRLEGNSLLWNQMDETEKKWQTVIDYIVQEQQKQEQHKAKEKVRCLAQLAADQATQCAICLEQITLVQEHKRDCTTCCSQFICIPCKERWMLEQHRARREPTCPLCRRRLT